MQVQKLSPEAQAIIHSYTDEITSVQNSMHAATGTTTGASSSSAANCAMGVTQGGSSGSPLAAWTAAVTHTLPWRTPRREDYLALLKETEYGAW
jgi:hypothetical protein